MRLSLDTVWFLSCLGDKNATTLINQIRRNPMGDSKIIFRATKRYNFWYVDNIPSIGEAKI